MTLILRQHVKGHYKYCINQLVAYAQQEKRYQSQDAAATHYDIIIAGGGLVGTTLAAAFVKNPTLTEKRILLLEGAGDFKGFNPQGGYANRVSAINQHTVNVFNSIGAWEHMRKARVQPVKQMRVWESYSDALIHFQHKQFARDIAYIVENDLMLDAMHKQLAGHKNFVKLTRARITDISLPAGTNSGYSEVKLKDGRTFSCELLVGADGANSLVRKAMNPNVYKRNYECMSLVATLQVSDAGDNTVAYQRFLPTGPVALLPLNNHTSSLVWSTTVPHARQLLSLPAEKFVAAINEAFCKQYARLELADKAVQFINSFIGTTALYERQCQYPPSVVSVEDRSRAIYPIGFLHSPTYASTGVAIIGDAAHRIHPLAGQGVNIGFSDVRYLIEALATGAYAGAKLSDIKYLLKYEQNCLAANVPIMLGVHGLHTLYSTNLSPIVLLRSLGLQITNNVPMIKHIFMQHAMG